MNQFHYDYIREKNERILQAILLENQIQDMHSRKPGLRVRFLFLISDLLLSIGAWIRPDEMRVFVHEPTIEDCAPFANCT